MKTRSTKAVLINVKRGEKGETVGEQRKREKKRKKEKERKRKR